MTENTGTQTPGVDNALWATPEKKATAIDRIRQWRGYRPRPLKRLSIPKKMAPSAPSRCRRGGAGAASHPSPSTPSDGRNHGGSPCLWVPSATPRRSGDSTRLEHLPPTPGGHLDLAGESAGFFDHSALPWLDPHLPMPKRLLSTWLRSGFWDRGPSFRPRQECPKAASFRPSSVIGARRPRRRRARGHWHRRGHQIHDVRWADDCIGTANSREALEHTVLPAVHAF